MTLIVAAQALLHGPSTTERMNSVSMPSAFQIHPPNSAMKIVPADRRGDQFPDDEDDVPEDAAAALSFIICCSVTRIAITIGSSSGW